MASKTGVCIREISPERAANLSLKVPSINVEAQGDLVMLLEKGTIFVDKTLLIKEILETKQKIVMIHVPAKWGKSININMIKSFFEIHVDRFTGKLIPANETLYYKFFTEGILMDNCYDATLLLDYIPWGIGTHLWKPIKPFEPYVSAVYKPAPLIGQHKSIVDEYLSKYPVIFLEWKIRTGISLLPIRHIVEVEVCKLFKKYTRLKGILNDTILNDETLPEKKEIFTRYLEKFIFIEEGVKREVGKRLNDTDIENSVLFLSEILHEQFGKQVIILMDDYIEILEIRVTKGHTIGEFGDLKAQEKELQLFKNFMRKSFIENPYLKKAVITGVVSVATKDMFGELDDVGQFNTVHNDFQEFYGWTHHEVDTLFDHFNISAQLAAEARDFYDGYTMLRNSNITVYNPWSVLRFLNEKRIHSFWAHDGEFDRVQGLYNIDNYKALLRRMIYGNPVPFDYAEANFNLMDSFSKRRFSEEIDDGKTYHLAMKSFFSRFCDYGFLTLASRARGYVGRRKMMSSRNYIARIPNKEIEKEINNTRGLFGRFNAGNFPTEPNRR